jgi:hypothetical protein
MGCTNSSRNSIEGTWNEFSDNYGLVERIFQNDHKVITRNYGCGGNPDYEIIQNYAIIDDILFIEAEAYNYFIFKNKLFLSRRENSNIYTKKESNISVFEQKKLLAGQWKESIPDWVEKDYIENIFEMEFFDNDIVIIKEYDKNKNIIGENTYPYEITDKYIILKNVNQKNSFSEFMNKYILDKGIYLYKINAKTLILKIFYPESGLFIEMLLRKE